MGAAWVLSVVLSVAGCWLLLRFTVKSRLGRA